MIMNYLCEDTPILRILKIRFSLCSLLGGIGRALKAEPTAKPKNFLRKRGSRRSPFLQFSILPIGIETVIGVDDMV